MNNRLQFSAISKTFPGVTALDNVSFEVADGQVHGLMGENGAGKSTLLNILGGQYAPSSGHILIGGQKQFFHGASDSIAAGIAIIHQELHYIPDLSVADNLMLGHFISRFGYLREAAAMALVRSELERMGVDIDPRAKLRDLSIAQRQMVEICKALMRDARIIALDEPTSSLSFRETDILFRLVDDLKRQNKALIYISHRVEEIVRLCDSCTIFRDGRKVASYPSLHQIPQNALISQMVGRDMADIYDYQPRPLGPEVLKVENVQGKRVPQPHSFEVRQGEILGFFGLVGAGRTELMKLIYGADKLHAGKIFLHGQELQKLGIHHSIANGIVFCPEDRKEEGIIGVRSVSENINMSVRRHDRQYRFFVNDKKEAATANRFIRLLGIKTPNRFQEIRLLSGGNQQKSILSRWLAEPNISVIIMDEPTRGIDVGAKHEIYTVMYALARKGCCIVMVSSDLPEVLGVSDRIVVMCQGDIVGELSHEEANENRVLDMALPKSATTSPSFKFEKTSEKTCQHNQPC